MFSVDGLSVGGKPLAERHYTFGQRVMDGAGRQEKIKKRHPRAWASGPLVSNRSDPRTQHRLMGAEWRALNMESLAATTAVKNPASGGRAVQAFLEAMIKTG